MKKLVFVFLGGLLAIAGAALATPGIGVLSAPVQARGTLADELNVHSDAGIKLKTKGAVDVRHAVDLDRAGRHDGVAQPSGAGVRDDQVG